MSERRIVYVVDDEEAIRRSLKLMLTVQGYSVTLFASGAALLDAVEGLRPGALLLDIRMPGIDGLDVQRELAAREARLPTIVMTGHGDLSIAVAALGNGALSFLEKPFTRMAAKEALDAAFLSLENPDAYDRQVAHAVDRLQALGEMERDTLRLLAKGSSTDAIARDLRAEASAIEMAQSRILSTLGVGTMSAALRIAFAAARRRAS